MVWVAAMVIATSQTIDPINEQAYSSQIEMKIIGVLLFIAMLPVMYILTMALFAVLLDNLGALWVAVPLVLAIIIFASLIA